MYKKIYIVFTFPISSYILIESFTNKCYNFIMFSEILKEKLFFVYIHLFNVVT